MPVLDTNTIAAMRSRGTDAAASARAHACCDIASAARCHTAFFSTNVRGSSYHDNGCTMCRCAMPVFSNAPSKRSMPGIVVNMRRANARASA